MAAVHHANTTHEGLSEQIHSFWLRLTIFGGACAGYGFAILTARHPTLVGIVLLTATTLAWLTLYHLLFKEQIVKKLWGVSALALLACLSILTAFAAMGFDWLLPVVTVGVIVMTSPLAFATVGLCVALWLVCALVMFNVTGHLDPMQLTLLVAFLFVLIFGVMLRRLLLARIDMQRLLATLADSKTELETAHLQLQEYATQVEELAVTRERNRIAREIHDTLGHSLTLLAVQLETAMRLEERGDLSLQHELLEARRVAKECLAEVRRSVAALRPAEITTGAFDVALERLVAEYAAVNTEVEISLDLEEATHELSPLLRATLYRCVQEALTNIRKHAYASKVLVRLRTEEQQVELTVLDNGQGRTPQADMSPPGFGLLGMRERVELLGGSVEAGAEPGRGWRVEVVLPRGKPEAQGTSTSTTFLPLWKE
jgi:signal transduction histidine kinase